MFEEIKKLGFGLMRLPKIDDETIDVEQVKVMVDHFLDAGFNYFDTARVYPGSEAAIKEALVDRYPRDKYFLATKNASWVNCKTREDAIAQFETSLATTGAGYFDFYLLHNLGMPRTKIADDFDMWGFVKQKKEEGLIKHYGFSFHSTPEELDELLTKHHDVDFVQLQINYADWENPAVKSRECYEVVRKHGKRVIIMEPVKGGMLANPPEALKKIFDKAEPDSSYPSWAIRFAASLDGVLVVLSGMSDIAQMDDNLKTMKDFNGLSKDEEKVIKEVRKELDKIKLTGCTSCKYCTEVCPNSIAIPWMFSALDSLSLFGDKEKAMKQYSNIFVRDPSKNNASSCLECGACEDACPQHLHIRDLLKEVRKEFED